MLLKAAAFYLQATALDNEKPAFVELIFSVDDPKIIEALRELDVEVEDGCVILSRKITQSRAARLIEPMMIDFPAPVSPDSIFSPSENSTSHSSMSRIVE